MVTLIDLVFGFAPVQCLVILLLLSLLLLLLSLLLLMLWFLLLCTAMVAAVDGATSDNEGFI